MHLKRKRESSFGNKRTLMRCYPRVVKVVNTFSIVRKEETSNLGGGRSIRLNQDSEQNVVERVGRSIQESEPQRKRKPPRDPDHSCPRDWAEAARQATIPKKLDHLSVLFFTQASRAGHPFYREPFESKMCPLQVGALRT